MQHRHASIPHTGLRVYLVFPIMLLLGLTVGQAHGQDSKARAIAHVDGLLARGAAASAAEDYQPAIDAAEEALRRSKESGYRHGEARAYDLLADLMLRTEGRTDKRGYNAELIEAARSVRDTLLLVKGLNRHGVYQLERGQLAEAEQTFRSLLDLGVERWATELPADVLSNLGSTKLAAGNHDEASQWFFKALRRFEQLDHGKGMGQTYSNIASVFYLMGRVDDAIDYQRKSIAVRETTGDEAGLVVANLNIGQLHLIKGDNAASRPHLFRALDYAEGLGNERLEAGAYMALGSFYTRNGVLDSALHWQSKAIAIYEGQGNVTQLSRAYAAAGQLAHRAGDSLRAAEYLHKALPLAMRLNNKENIANAHEILGKFHEDHGNLAQALAHHKSGQAYRDSIAAQSAAGAIEAVKTQYETEKKDFEIARLVDERRIRQLEIAGKENEIALLSQAQELQHLRLHQQGEELERQKLAAQSAAQRLQLKEQEQELQARRLQDARNVRNLLVVGLVLLASVGYFLFNRHRLKRTIRHQENLLAIRADIAKDLHDEIGSTLTSIQILSDASGKKLQTEQAAVSTYLEQISSQSALAQQGMSDIVWAVKPDNDRLGKMQVRMREYVAQTLEQAGTDVVWRWDEALEDQALDMDQRRALLLLFKEAINNVAKHARATEVVIALGKADRHLVLAISDNGVGFDPRRETSSSGLANMKKRAEAMGGTLAIDTAVGKGTALTARMPIKR